MRLKPTALLMMALTIGLAGCNDTLDSVVDPSTVKNKVEYQLPSRVRDEMKAKGMERNSPIAMRIFKEEGVLEIWKAKTNNRFDKIAEYQICAWSGRLGPKVKEGDRQAPEGFYPLSPYHLNPNSKYFLAINTGYPNRYDQANGRNGSNLMIHGACSSSGCYSMTDAQILEIYAFARDAFKGGQQTVQLQAFPFRMTADNMARHQHSPHYEFWKMLKVGYDNFEVTKRPPEVGVCEKKYVFNQQVEEGKTLNGAAACPPMTTPPALQVALASYNAQYERDFAKASKKYDGKIWYDPSEAERKALVAEMRKGHDLAYAPTGSALKAGKLLKIEEFEKLVAEKDTAAKPVAAPAKTATSAQPSAKVAEVAQTASVPVPQSNPLAPAPVTLAAEGPRKPFWKFWQK
ncbi:murein L,D-transpeptidase family protein [Ciceribacter sp. RN22]|uniref:L,D-transpeptidase family protein n=1 Tax=Ciceribacter sp. RN22 TaxID=2954932 RepID=UPI002093B951|nr:murein L,D-transpeptidase family protein [Ciceribacter sp. RN22]MCO6180255.1 murein L,D-transpeptidase [Ciceribacter sp. RN22]